MSGIFISYRREDSQGEARHLFDDLKEYFGADHVFMDVTGIEPGKDFRRVIEGAVSSCDVLIAMIGKKWLDVVNESGTRRLNDPEDFVRLETGAALRRRDVTVIPLLVQNAAMPRSEQLPSELETLAWLNAFELRHNRWDIDIAELVEALRKMVPADGTTGGGMQESRPQHSSGKKSTTRLSEKLIGLIAVYLDDLVRLISGPKRFIAERFCEESASIQRALTFLAVSFLIGWVLMIPLERGDIVVAWGTDAVFVLITVMMYGGALYLAWRIAGGRAEIPKVLTIHFYYAGVLKLMTTSLYLGVMGTIRAADPALYQEIYEAVYSGNASFFITNAEQFFASPGFSLLLWVQLIGYGAALTWIFVGWGAYRELNRLSKFQSVVAGLLFCVFFIPVTALTFLIANALVK